jgi:hypothetical protein
MGLLINWMRILGDSIAQNSHQSSWCVHPDGSIYCPASMSIYGKFICIQAAGCLSQNSTVSVRLWMWRLLRLGFFYLVLYSYGSSHVRETFVLLAWAWRMWTVVLSAYRTEFCEDGLKRWPQNDYKLLKNRSSCLKASRSSKTGPMLHGAIREDQVTFRKDAMSPLSVQQQIWCANSFGWLIPDYVLSK